MKKPSLAAAARAAFSAIRADAPNDRFYLFALCTTAEGGFVGATAWSEEALARVGGRRFATTGSPFHRTHDAVFAGFEPGRKLHEACFEALRTLDGNAFFGKGGARSKTIINVVYEDMTNARWLENADRLNSGVAVARARGFFEPR